MDILQLVDELETIINKSFRIPFTSNILINEDDLFDVLDQMRISIPQEIKEAKRTEAERERILARAQEERDRLVGMAKEKIMTAVDDQEVVEIAKQQRDEIISQAQEEASRLKMDADTYVTDHLSDLEEQLLKLLSTVQNGIRQLQISQTLPTAQQNPAAQNQTEPNE